MAHMHATQAYPNFCEIHMCEYYPRTCGHATGCRQCDLDAAFKLALSTLPSACRTRLTRALRLASRGKVTVNGDLALVESLDGHREYRIRGRCNCRDARWKAPRIRGVPACKHQLAVWLVRRADGTPSQSQEE